MTACPLRSLGTKAQKQKVMPEPPTPNQSSPPARPPESIWALRVATVAGIPIRLHFTFLLFLLWIGLSGRHGASGLSLLYVLAVFACVLLHEMGHSLVALRYGIPVADITLYPIGGVASIEKRPTAKQELWIALAGPAVNVIIALVLLVVLMALGIAHLTPAATVAANQRVGLAGFLSNLLIINVALVAFNMVPAFPMDGGRVLRAILALNMPPERATAFAAAIGQGIAIVAGIWAVSSGEWRLMFVALFVYLGAGQEAASYRQAALVENVAVRQAMMTDVRTLMVGQTLKEAADVLLDTSQHDFPVLHGSAVQGVLTRNGLLRGLAERGPEAYVAGTMNREFLSAHPDDDLGEMIPQLQGRAEPVLVLDPTDETRLLGILTGENIAEFFAIRQIAATRKA